MDTRTPHFIADLVEEVGCLPSVAAQIVTMASDVDCDMDALAKVILSDNVMSLRFLALANSAALSRGREIRDLKGTLVRLGLRRVRNVALCMGMHDLLPADGVERVLNMNEFWRHSLATASCAQTLARRDTSVAGDDAWLVGILHGIGIATLEQKLAAEYQGVLAWAIENRQPLWRAEQTILDFHHGELGGQILAAWKLPRVFRDAVTFTCGDAGTEDLGDETRTLIRLVRGAVDTASSAGFGANGDGTPPPSQAVVIQQLGISDADFAAMLETAERDVGQMSRLIGLETNRTAEPQDLAESSRHMARLGLEGIDETMAREGIEEQLAMARDIQQHLLPDRMPDLAGFEIAAVNQPSFHVSGDFYDFFPLKSGGTAVVIADVSGKGLPAALLASNLQASLRTLGRIGHDPGDLLAAVSETLLENSDAELFATLFLAVVEPGANSLVYASAGHNPPLLLRSGNEVERLKPTGPSLGMFPAAEYTVRSVAVAPGDLLIAYTDGVTEAVDEDGDEFGDEALVTAATAAAADPASRICRRLLAAVTEYRSGGGADNPTAGLIGSGVAKAEEDDLTLVVAKVL